MLLSMNEKKVSCVSILTLGEEAGWRLGLGKSVYSFKAVILQSIFVQTMYFFFLITFWKTVFFKDTFIPNNTFKPRVELASAI